jgi:hypothetical protein
MKRHKWEVWKKPWNLVNSLISQSSSIKNQKVWAKHTIIISKKIPYKLNNLFIIGKNILKNTKKNKRVINKIEKKNKLNLESDTHPIQWVLDLIARLSRWSNLVIHHLTRYATVPSSIQCGTCIYIMVELPSMIDCLHFFLSFLSPDN